MVKKGNNQITNYFSKMRVHLMRSTHDCMITSSETVIKDNPKLMKKIAKKGREKYFKIFSNVIISQFLVDKTFGFENKYKYIWS